MARFFFHFVCKDGWVPDREGTELDHLKDAHRHAMQLIDQATSGFEDANDWRDWMIQITGADHRSHMTVLFPVVRPLATPLRRPVNSSFTILWK
jgi:hypothetical protein